MNPEEFQQTLAAHGINLSETQMAQFHTYYQYLVEVNEHVNLTAITSLEDVYLKHFYDSILPGVQIRLYLSNQLRCAMWVPVLVFPQFL